jgi:hypothetical protein
VHTKGNPTKQKLKKKSKTEHVEKYKSGTNLKIQEQNAIKQCHFKKCYYKSAIFFGF